MNAKPSTRLWVILAREAPVAVVFRRGPSRHVRLIKWNLDSDTFEHGQWLQGRIYERRCDLSPSGSLLIYFAATYKKPLQSWTAISKPPRLTAVALWPKGDGWNGGGWFTGSDEIHLEHFAGYDIPHPDFVDGCRQLRISSRAEWRGEDAPVWNTTLRREGWELVAEGGWSEQGEVKGFAWKARSPVIWRRPHPRLPFALEMRIDGIHQLGGPWYLTSYCVVNDSGEVVLDLEARDWANWQTSGDLLSAHNGCLYRQVVTTDGPQPARLLVDLSDQTFEPITAPAWAQTL